MPPAQLSGEGEEPANGGQTKRERSGGQSKAQRLADKKKQNWPPKNPTIVDVIKSLSGGGREAWAAFCRSQEGKNRDPARYPVDVLQQFLQGLPSDFPIVQNGSGNRLVNHQPYQDITHASETVEEDHPEFCAQEMRVFIDMAVDQLRASPHWKYMPPHALRVLISEIKGQYPDCEERLYSKSDVVELMAHTGRMCGDILQLDGSGDVQSTSSPSQDLGHTRGQAVPGDFVMLQGSTDAKLNRGTGFVVEHTHHCDTA